MRHALAPVVAVAAAVGADTIAGGFERAAALSQPSVFVGQVTLSGTERWVVLPPVDAHLSSLVHRGDEQSNLDRQSSISSRFTRISPAMTMPLSSTRSRMSARLV